MGEQSISDILALTKMFASDEFKFDVENFKIFSEEIEEKELPKEDNPKKELNDMNLFTIEDIKRAFEDGRNYEAGQLEIDLTGPTAFDSWFNHFKRNL